MNWQATLDDNDLEVLYQLTGSTDLETLLEDHYNGDEFADIELKW